MTYVEGIVLAVPAENKEAYRQLAAGTVDLFKESGATRLVEAWGDDVPNGELTDFRRAVKAKQDEVIVFAWIEYPDKETHEAAGARIMDDPRMQEIAASTLFESKRMIYGGFASIIEERFDDETGYIDGSLMPVPLGSKDAYRDMVASQAAVFKEYGATRIVDAWADAVPDGDVTDYKSAVMAGRDEAVVFSWIEWPSKTVRDQAWPKIFADPRMHPETVYGDNRRRVYGGFEPIVIG